MSRAVSRLGVRAELRWTLLKEYKCKEYVGFRAWCSRISIENIILNSNTGTNICDEGVTSLLAYTWSNCLQRIDASHCEAITNIGISVIATRCAQSLQKIQLSRCTGVSDDGIAILAQHCPRLRYVDVRGVRAR